MDLFAYGTLMVAQVMRAVSGHAGAGEPASLDGYRRRRLTGEVYPALVPDPAGRVEGIIYRGLSAAQWAALDRFEGAAYRRTRVMVRVGLRSRPAETYVLAPGLDHLLGDGEWSLDAFVAQGLRAFVDGYPGFRSAPDPGSPNERG